MLTISYYSNVNFPWEISSNIILHVFHLLHIHRNFPKLQLTVANLHKKLDARERRFLKLPWCVGSSWLIAKVVSKHKAFPKPKKEKECLLLLLLE